MMTQELKQQIALFRYSLIAPLITETYSQESAKAYLEEICARRYQTPKGQEKEYSPKTLKHWLSAYRRYGIDGLYPKVREDKGESRKLTKDVQESILLLKGKYPKRTAKSIYHELVVKGVIPYDGVSLSTVQRFLSKNRLQVNQHIKDRRAFEFEYPNECWQSDISVGPYLLIEGKKYRTYIIAILDDASRLVVHCEAFYTENLNSLLTVMKKAVAKRGIPKKLFVDNGKVFKSNQLQMICASLGTILSFAQPYSPESKGKIERWFKTLQDSWLNTLDWRMFSSLEDFNLQLQQYVEKGYNQQVHSSIQERPIDKFLKGISHVKFVGSKEELDNLFLHRILRKVKNDATVSIESQLFEVPLKFMGQRIHLRYDPTDFTKAYIFSENHQRLETVYPVAKIDNTKVRRRDRELQITFSAFGTQVTEDFDGGGVDV